MQEQPEISPMERTGVMKGNAKVLGEGKSEMRDATCWRIRMHHQVRCQRRRGNTVIKAMIATEQAHSWAGMIISDLNGMSRGKEATPRDQRRINIYYSQVRNALLGVVRNSGLLSCVSMPFTA